MNPGLVAIQLLGIVVVVRVEPDAVRALDLRLGRPVVPGDAVHALGGGRRDALVLAPERGQLRVEEAGQARRRPVGAVEPAGRRAVERDLEALCGVALRLGVGERRRSDRCTTSTARTPSRRSSSRPGSPRRTGRSGPRCRRGRGRRRSSPRRPCSRSGRYQRRGTGLRSSPIKVTRLASRRCCSSACGIATLSRSTQSGCRSPRLGPEEQVVGPDRRDAVAFLAGPRRVALARVDDRAAEVVGERGRLAAVDADRPEGHGGAQRRRRRVRVQRRDGGGAVGEYRSAAPWYWIVWSTMPAPGVPAVVSTFR